MMTIDVDKAWNRLHARLTDDRLLDVKMAAVPFITRIKLVAAVVALCIGVGAAGLYLLPAKEHRQLFTLHNSEASNTLVSTLGDGSVVYLADGATLTCPARFDAGMRRVALQGEALFDVHGVRDCPFLVETEPAVVEVLGTSFNIKSDGSERFVLSVQRGSVKVTLKATGEQTMVEAGETVHLETGRQLLKEPSHDRQQFVRYTEKMRFKDERLENIVRVINKISDKPVVFADQSLAEREMTVAFASNTPSDMVELLCLAMDLSHTERDGSIVIAAPVAP